MELFLQLGHGMMAHAEALLSLWGGGGVVYSPRDVEPERLIKFAESIRAVGGRGYFDPQLYVPRADYARLLRYPHWPIDYATGVFWQGERCQRTLTELITYNGLLNTNAVILPAELCSSVDDNWIGMQRSIIGCADSLLDINSTFATVALSSNVMVNEDQVATLVEEVSSWPVGGVYLICESIEHEYFDSNVSWLCNQADIVASIKLASKQVIVGYCNQQSLFLAPLMADALASGTWQNVRSFDTSKFFTPEDDEERRKAIWFYYPDSLSEYKRTLLDAAFTRQILGELRPSLDMQFCNDLFADVTPSSSGFGESQAHRHYLHSLWHQCQLLSLSGYEESKNYCISYLERVQDQLAKLHNLRLRGEYRDFQDVAESTIQALVATDERLGAKLKRRFP